MRLIAEEVELLPFKDERGRIIESKNEYVANGKTYRCDFIMPFGTNNTEQRYGLDLNSTHRTFTYDNMQENAFIRDKDNPSKVYKVLSVQVYGMRSVVILELM